MKKVYKYSIPVSNEFEIDLSKGAEILSFQCQHGMPFIWVLINPDAVSYPRRFWLVDTGQTISDIANKLRYVGTAQMRDGNVIKRLFEKV